MAAAGSTASWREADLDAGLARHTVMPGKKDESVSPYLRRPLRKYEDVTRGKADRSERPDPEKGNAEPGDSRKANPSSKSEDRT